MAPPPNDDHKEESWIDEYNAAMSRKPAGPPKMPAIPSCAVCCTFFSTFGALFLFVVAGLMRSKYRYIHIEGDLDALSKPVTYAGFVYLIFTAVSLCFWSRASARQKAWKERIIAQMQGAGDSDSDINQLALN